MTTRTNFSLRLLKKIVKEAEDVKASELQIELGINRRIAFVDEEGQWIKDAENH